MKPVLVLQHVPYETQGSIGDHMRAHDIAFDVVRLWEPYVLPDLSRYAALIVMGGPMAVYEDFPSKKDELALIKAAIGTVPMLGICLGSQLLAHALGARVYPNERDGKPAKEVGYYTVQLTPDGQASGLLERFPSEARVLEWHGDAFDLPPGASLLATSPVCRNQAFAYKNAYGLLFHLESTPEMVAGLADATREWAHRDFDLDEAALLSEARSLAPLMKEQSDRLLDNFFAEARRSEETPPFHLRGNFAPVRNEVTAFDLPVQGAIPRALRGLYVRNGPNPKSGTSAHWFVGDGMLHGVELRDGRAVSYRNRWVRTRAFVEDAKWLRPDYTRDITVGLANTHVVTHAGRILALVETSLPTEVTPALDTVGCFDYHGRLTTGMTAHPKLCPRTGELHFFAYHYMAPFLTYHRADAGGRLVRSEVIEVPGPTMIHDFAITEQHVVFMDLPLVFDVELAMAGRMPYRWSDDYGARLGLMPRGGGHADVRWFEIEPCYVFHPLNAYEDEPGAVVIDVVRYAELWRANASGAAPASLHRWRIAHAAGRVSEQPLDDRAIEFPRVDDRRMGAPYRYGYAVYTERGVDRGTGTALIKYDLRSGTSGVHDFGAGRVPAEPVFVPASASAGEDEGWLLTYVYDAARDGSDLVILDAADVGGKPVATIALPQRVPFGFHGSWIAEAR